MGVFRQFPYTNFHELNLDQIIFILRQMQDEWKETKEEWSSLKAFVDNYFNNLNVSKEVADKLDKMAKDGSLYNIIAPDMAGHITSWLNTHIAGDTGVIDNTLTVSGAAADAMAAGQNDRALFTANVIDIAKYGNKSERNSNGIRFVWSSDNTCHVTGTSVAVAFCNLYANTTALPENWKVGDRIRVKYSGNKVGIRVIGYGANETVIRNILKYGDNSFTVTDQIKGLIIRLEVAANVSGVDENVKPVIINGFTNNELVSEAFVSHNDSEDIQIIAEYELINNYITSGGNYDTSGKRTSPLKITPATRYYTSYDWGVLPICGCFYDHDMNYLTDFLPSRLINDDDIIKHFDTPDNAYYMIINRPKYAGTLSFCTRPFIFPGMGNLDNSTEPKINCPVIGNIRIPQDNFLRQSKKHKKLCCIGDSITYIDRRQEAGILLGNRVAGWQEYIGLFYDSVTSFGFSGGAWGPYSGSTSKSIYEGIVTDHVDLTGYDEFILFGGFNGMGTVAYQMGYLETYRETEPDNTTMLGAMRSVINYIYTQNPEAVIYVMLPFHTGAYYNYPDAVIPRMKMYRDRIIEGANSLGMRVIDIENKAGFTPYNRSKVTYDWVHPNNYGMYMIGKTLVNELSIC